MCCRARWRMAWMSLRNSLGMAVLALPPTSLSGERGQGNAQGGRVAARELDIDLDVARVVDRRLPAQEEPGSDSHQDQNRDDRERVDSAAAAVVLGHGLSSVRLPPKGAVVSSPWRRGDSPS